MFDKGLGELVKGIRAQKREDGRRRYISACINDVREELKSTNGSVKAVALQKLVYLQMLGYDVGFAGFEAVMLCSSNKFGQKRIGYLYCCVALHHDADVITITENLLKKDFGSQSSYETAISLNCLSNIVTTELARNLSPIVIGMCNSSNAFVRKKAVLLLYKIFLVFPDALRPAFPRLRDRLSDSDPSVVNAAVNVICELGLKNPKNYLSLVPALFKLLTTHTTNWMLIKLVKLFGALTPLEPRLGKKLLEPLTNIINTTSATSLLYEAINACSVGLTSSTAVIRLCMEKLKAFAEDSDQNIKYLGLLGMANILKSHPKLVAEQREVIMTCLNDRDITIRRRALELVQGMVSRKNLKEIVAQLLEHSSRAETRDREDLIKKILEICSSDGFAMVTDFAWYLEVLSELARVPHGTTHGFLLAEQLLEVGVRVESSRGFAVEICASLLGEVDLLWEGKAGQNTAHEVLTSAAYICAEFSEHVRSGYVDIVATLLQPRIVVLPPHIQAVFLHNAVKVYARAAARVGEGDGDVTAKAVQEMRNCIDDRLPQFALSMHVEVQERSVCLCDLVDACGDNPADLALLFESDLNPVSAKAQRKVPRPKGIDLDAWIYPPEEKSVSEPSSENEADREFEERLQAEQDVLERSEIEASEKSRAADSRRRRAADPFYLQDAGSSPVADVGNEDDDVDSGVGAESVSQRSSASGSFSLASVKGRRRRKGDKKPVVVNLESEMPEGVEDVSSDSDTGGKAGVRDKVSAALNVDLSKPYDPSSEGAFQAVHAGYEGPNSTPRSQVEEKSGKPHRHRHRRHREGQQIGEHRHRHRHGHRDGKEPKSEADLLEFDVLDSVGKGDSVKSGGSASRRRQHGRDSRGSPPQSHRSGAPKSSRDVDPGKGRSSKRDRREKATGEGELPRVVESKWRPFFDDDVVSCKSLVRLSLETRSAVVVIRMMNISSSRIENIDLSLKSTLCLRLDVPETVALIEGRQVVDVSVPIHVSGLFGRGQRLKGSLRYVHDEVVVSGVPSLLLAVSDFVMPKSLPVVDVSKHLLEYSSQKVMIGSSASMQAIAGLLHLHVLVGELEGQNVLLGEWVSNGDLCGVFITVRGRNQLEVVVRAADDALAAALFNEISATFV